MYCAELLGTYCKSSAVPFEWHEWRQSERLKEKNPGSQGLELPLPQLAGKSAKMQTISGCSLSSKQIAVGAKGRQTWAGNSSLSFILFVCVKIPLCPHPFSHPVPALSIHQSPHFVSADFIPALTITLQPSPGHRGHPPPQARSLPLPDWYLLTEGPARCLSVSIALASKNTNTQPDSDRPAFHLSYWGDRREKDTRREKQGGGG